MNGSGTAKTADCACTWLSLLEAPEAADTGDPSRLTVPHLEEGEVLAILSHNRLYSF